ncbi:MAG: M48 metallopeptidase family protein, partial [Steroidobacteraceae bacterium]
PAIAHRYTVEYEHRPVRTADVIASDASLLVRGPLHADRAILFALRRWLAEVADVELTRELREVARAGGFQFSRLQIRRQRTRWGSCSAAGTISLNVCLLFLRPPVVRYLLVHELCHTKHMNHSPRFWSLVAHHEPNYQALDRELLRGWQAVPGWMFA